MIARIAIETSSGFAVACLTTRPILSDRKTVEEIAVGAWPVAVTRTATSPCTLSSLSATHWMKMAECRNGSEGMEHMVISARAAEVMTTFKYAGQVESAKIQRAQAQKRLHQVLTVLGVLAVAGALAVPGLYIMQFHGPLSTNTEDWNRFGGFVGGTLGPFFSALTIAAVLAGVLLQREQLDLAAEQAEGALIHETVVLKLQEQASRAMAAQAEHAAISAKANALASVRELMEQEIQRIQSMQAAVGTLDASCEVDALLAQAQARHDAVAVALQRLVDQLIGVNADGTPLGMQPHMPPAQPAAPAS